MSYVVGIDPGFDGTGVAFFDLDRWSGSISMEAALRCLVDFAVVRTDDPTMPMPTRLQLIGEGLDELLAHHREQGHEIAAAFVEVGYAGVYHERRGRQRGKSGINAEAMRRFFAGFGTAVYLLSARLGSGRVHLVPAHGWQKSKRHALLATAFRRVGKACPRNGDIRDAIWIGAMSDWSPFRPSSFAHPQQASAS